MELIDKLKDYIKLLESNIEGYSIAYYNRENQNDFESGFWYGMRENTQACINDLKRMIEETEEL